MPKMLWSQRQIMGPAARGSHAIAFDPARKRTTLFGGTDSEQAGTADTWEWDGQFWVQVAETFSIT